jgi:hypothetical protein
LFIRSKITRSSRWSPAATTYAGTGYSRSAEAISSAAAWCSGRSQSTFSRRQSSSPRSLAATRSGSHGAGGCLPAKLRQDMVSRFTHTANLGST